MWLGSCSFQAGIRQLIVRDTPSPNFGPRRDGAKPDLIVIHYTAMRAADAACRALCDPSREVSAHYLIARNGAVQRLVPEADRAWHAGAGRWGDITDVNSRSIGIELDNDGYSPFSAPLMDSLTVLLGDVRARWAIPDHGVIGHSDIAPGRKIDPGPRFDWQRLARLGHGVWPSVGVAPADFVNNMRLFGYTATTDPTLLLQIFRLRFAPHRIGPLCDADRCEIADLAARFPVDASGLTA